MKKMPRGSPPPRLFSFSSSSIMTTNILVAFICLIILGPSSVIIPVSAQSDITASAKSFPPFTPSDNYLVDCGSTSPTTLQGNRTFQPDQNTVKYLAYSGRDIQISGPDNNNVPSLIYLNAKIFVSEATYTFHVTNPGLHWIRLHFFPLQNNEFNLQIAKFSVSTDTLFLLKDYQMEKNKAIMKEFLVNVTTERYAIKFAPSQGSFAFVNALEFVTAPSKILDYSVPLLFPVSQKFDLSTSNFETTYRLNVGGSYLDGSNDTLGRSWLSDAPFRNNATGQVISVQPSVIQYPTAGGSPFIAPPTVYSSAVKMADSETTIPNFNISWTMDIDTSYSYLIRLHFCDIISKSLNELYFNVYINDKMAISGLDLSSLTQQLSTAFYKDFVVDSSTAFNPLSVKVSPVNDVQGFKNAILNGLEVFRMNNSLGSLDGENGVDGKNSGPSKTVAYVGFAMMFGAFVGLGATVFKWQKRPQDWQKTNSFSSWLLPLHAGDASFMTSKASLSRKSQFFSSTMGLGRYFSFAELSDATNNWDSNAIIGVGGFGNVYYGEIDDGTKVAVKRGNPQSEQGINEFHTEIQMLSKLRHRHLVSLIGYCDENTEMILVYEFMQNGPFRDHLYGKNFPPLTWKQRLEICIGSARGLHYLHTGASTAIIHRDVKTTNILLDENLVAKMADFGLSKDCLANETHVSTAVKGSFGYLDPEYFRKQQLTDKSDVYSFGVVLLEALCTRPAINPALPREQVNLAEWAMQWKRKGLLDKIIDPTLVGNINPESMKKFAEAAEKCLAEYGADRPTMGDVLWNLEYALQLQEASLQGKAEEENKVSAAPASPAIVAPTPVPTSAPSTPDNRPVSSPEQTRNPAELQTIDDHSGTAMFAQFAELNGR